MINRLGLEKTLAILLVVILFVDVYLTMVNGQQPKRKPSRKKPNRNRNNKKKQQDEGLYCYACFGDFEHISLTVANPVNFIYNNNCYNLALNYSIADREYLTKCSSTTKYCMVDITRSNGVLISVDRRCGQSTCRKTCLSRGYGVIRETCTFCCGGRINEDHPEYDEELHAAYKCPIEPH